MKKKTSSKPTTAVDDDMLPHYDFTGGVRGKHYKARLAGYTIKIHKRDGTTLVKDIKREGVVTLEPDVREYFPTSKAVNRALRTLIGLVPERRKIAATKARSSKSGRKLTAKGRVKKLR